MRNPLSVKIIAVAAVLMIMSAVYVSAEGGISGIYNTIEEMQQKAEEVSSKLTPENLVNVITSNLLSYIKQLSAYFGIAIAVIIISSVFTSINNNSSQSSIYNLISKCLIIISVFPPVIMCFGKICEHIKALCGFMLSFIPTAVLLHTASGNTLSAAVLSNIGSSAIAVLQIVSTGLIVPMLKAIFSLSMINLLCSKANLSGISSMLKSISLWIIGLFFTLFSGILSLQTLLQSSADNLAVKGLKYSAAKLIPIAGGMVSESMKTVITAIGFIKSVTGISGIVFIIYTIIPPLCFILVTKLYMSLLSAFAKSTCEKELPSFLDGLNSSLNHLLALMISSSISFIILLAMFIKTNVSI